MTSGGDRRSRSSRALLDRLSAVRRADRASPDTARPLTDEHPLAKAVGLLRAAELLDGVGDARQALARDRREQVEQLSREGRPVREIAAATGLSYNHVVALRMRLGVTRKDRAAS
jgi:DNA-directed RNA polymerase specialized sigma24 family protein